MLQESDTGLPSRSADLTESEEYIDWVGEEAGELLEEEGAESIFDDIWQESRDWGTASFDVDADTLGFTANIFPKTKMRRDENVSLDQMLASLFSEIRFSRVEKAMFFAAAIDRMGYSEGLWMNLGIFSFREIGYGYPEAPIYVYDYYCSWLEEMRRHREELACRLRYACTHAILSKFPSIYSRVKDENPENPMDIKDFVTTYLSEEERQELLEDIRVLMTTPESMSEYPLYDTPCSCHLRKSKTMNRKSEAENEDTLFAELGMTSHLTTARHILFSIINYLCALPKSSLSLDVSFHTAYKCQGKLMDQDWTIRLSFTELDYALFKIRKTREDAVQQLVICLCCSIIHGDEERAVRMTDLFHTWNEEELFWESLLTMCDVHRDCYQWVRPYLLKYRDAWRAFDGCKDYFIEGCRTSLFTATLLIVRGPPPRDRQRYNSSFPESSSSMTMPSPAMPAFRNNLVLTPSQINYSRDYVKIIYGSQTPSYRNLEFLTKYSPCPFSHAPDDTEKSLDSGGNRIVSMLKDADETCVDLMSRRSDKVSTDEFLSSKTVAEFIHSVIPYIGKEYTGNMSCGREPYVVKCYSDPTSRRKRKDASGSLRSTLRVKRVSHSSSIPNINFRAMLNRSTLNSKRGTRPAKVFNKGGPSSQNRRRALSSPSSPFIRAPMSRSGSVLMDTDENLEVSIDEGAIDWTTQLGRYWGKGYRNAHLNSHNYRERSKISNQYFACNEAAIEEQEKDAKKKSDERAIAMRGMVNGLTAQRLLAPSLYEDTESEAEDDALTHTQEWRRYIQTMKRIEELECTTWYDPGMPILYRKYSTELLNIQNQLLEMAYDNSSPDGKELLSSRQIEMFKTPNDFLLNQVNVETCKEDISTRVIGRDDILRRLDQFETIRKVPVIHEMPNEEKRIVSIAEAGRSQSVVDDLSRGISDHCNIYSSADSSESSDRELRRSRKRWYRVLDEDKKEEMKGEEILQEEEEGDTTTIGDREPLVNLNVSEASEASEAQKATEDQEGGDFSELVGRPRDENVVVSHRVFLPKDCKGSDTGPMLGSLAYVVLEPSTKELFSLVSLGPFDTEEQVERVVTDIDFRESLSLPNIYVAYAMNWAHIGYDLMKKYLRMDMDEFSGTSGTSGTTVSSYSQTEDRDNIIDSILRTMHKMKKISSMHIPAGYKTASEFILDKHPFYPNCILSNMSPHFGETSIVDTTYHREIVPVDNTDFSKGYYLHYSVKICKLPFVLHASEEKWAQFLDFCYQTLIDDYDRHQLELNFLSKHDTVLSDIEYTTDSNTDGYKLLETLLYYGVTKGIHEEVGVQARKLCESIVFTYSPAIFNKEPKKELVFSMAPMYMDYLTICNREQMTAVGESEEISSFYASASHFFRDLCKHLVAGEHFYNHMPDLFYQSIVGILQSEEGHLWYGDTTNLWSSVVKSNMPSKEHTDYIDQVLEVRSLRLHVSEEGEGEGGEIVFPQQFTIADIIVDYRTIERVYHRMYNVTPRLMLNE